MAAVFPAASRSVISSSKDWGLAGGPSGKAPLRGHGCFGWSLAFLHHLRVDSGWIVFCFGSS